MHLPSFVKYTVAFVFLAAILQNILWHVLYRTSNTPLDPAVGNTRLTKTPYLHPFYNTKRILVVGGTRGIGRGMAMALAQQGASVTIVGRQGSHGGQDTVARLQATTTLSTSTSTPELKFIPADLSTLHGVFALATKLHYAHGQFDEVVFTINQFPNPLDPTTTDGHDRSIGIGVLARFVLLRRLVETRLLAHGARILSICASTKTEVLPPSWGRVQSILNRQQHFDGSIASFMATMGTMSYVHDTMVQVFAKKYKGLTLIGMHPGFVVTDLMQNTIFPKWCLPWLKRCMAPFSRSEKEIGWIGVQVLASPNVDKLEREYDQGRGQGRKGKYLYLNSLGEGRQSLPETYDGERQEWVEQWFDQVFEEGMQGMKGGSSE